VGVWSSAALMACSSAESEVCSPLGLDISLCFLGSGSFVKRIVLDPAIFVLLLLIRVPSVKA
jgi:hypothetical protein